MLARLPSSIGQRNKALESLSPPQLLNAIEAQMAQAAASIATARRRATESLAGEILEERDRDPDSVFPWARLTLQGHLEGQAVAMDEGDMSDAYRQLLASMRDRDRAAGRTLIGPHRSDIEVIHGPKSAPAKICSTGEQKALLIGLVLAHSRLIKKTSDGMSPLILLDEIAAHLDVGRRLALFSSIASLNAQVWMTGTDADIFLPLGNVIETQFFCVSNGAIVLANDAESASEH